MDAVIKLTPKGQRWRAPRAGLLCAGLAVVGFALGCRAPHAPDPEYVAIAPHCLSCQPTHEAVTAAMMPQFAELAGPHGVEEYIAFALAQNPQVQAKRKLVDAAAMRVPQAASLADPTIEAMGFPFFPNVPQTASGRATVGLTVSQPVPWFGTLRTRAEAAEAEANMARAELAAAELEVVEQVKRVYYELYFVQKSLTITEQSRKLAVQFSELAADRLRANLVPQQDLLRAQLEVSNIDAELVRMRQELQSGQAELAQLLHVSPDTPVLALGDLPSEQIPQDLERLYAQAIVMRPELHAQLAAIERDRYSVDLARLKYYPDFAMSFSWEEMSKHKALAPTADGLDNLGVGVMANVPIYRGRLNASVREAEAKAVASARQYDALRDRTQREVKNLFVQARSQQELLRLFGQEIIPKAEQTLKVSLPAYEAGRISILQWIDNWQQLLKYRLAQQRVEAQLRQTLASLERVVGRLGPAEGPPQP
jgi:cobalt-zinc-cadmium efflux system outer membrane protein